MNRTSKNRYNLLEDKIAVLRKRKGAITSEQDACNGKVCRLQAWLRRYRDACNHVAKHLIEGGTRLKAGREASENNTEDVVSSFLRGLVLSIKD